MRALITAAICLAWSPASGQVIAPVPPPANATVAIFGSAATDPNLDSPVSVVTYPNNNCRATWVEETTPITDPTVAYWMSAPGSNIECRADITKQVQALSPGTYKAAVKIGAGVYAPLSTTFTRS